MCSFAVSLESSLWIKNSAMSYISSSTLLDLGGAAVGWIGELNIGKMY